MSDYIPPNYGLFISNEQPIFKDCYFSKEDFIPGMLVYDFENNTYSTDGYTFLTPKLITDELHTMAKGKGL